MSTIVSANANTAASATGQRAPEGSKSPWILVAGGFHGRGGMDRANAELARYLSSTGVNVHLVSHDVEDELMEDPKVHTHLVPRFAGIDFLGQRLLNRRGRALAFDMLQKVPGTRVLVNGVNCEWSDINWIHFVHQNWLSKQPDAPLWFRFKNGVDAWANSRKELRLLKSARFLIANSDRTRADLIRDIGVSAERIHTVYLGCGSEWQTVTPERRAAARVWLDEPSERPLVAFVGAFGYDSRKGFDTLWSAWQSLCQRAEWDVDLIAAGGGRALPRWRQSIARAGLESRVRLLGFTNRISDLLCAADLLISPVRYESYGLNVQEAISSGVPAIVSRIAGVAERYPADLADLLLPDPEDSDELVLRLLRWRSDMENLKIRIAPFAAALRAWTWRDMAAKIVSEIDNRR